MKAITQHRYGGPEVLEYGEVPIPVPADGEVLIRVRAASINAADWLLMRGEPLIVRLAFGMRRPKIAVKGRDVAGVIEALGNSVHGFSVGDEVYAEVDTGSLAEFAVVPVRRLALKPSTLTFVEAAAVPLSGTTALQGLRDVAKPGVSVLINGASGGVGTFAVQVATALGAEVTAVCSTRNLGLVRSLGADHVIDYTAENFTTGAARYDVIFDLVSNHSLSQLRRTLTPRGTLVLASGAGGRVLGPLGRILAALVLGMFVRQRLRPLTATANGQDLETLRELIESGAVSPSIEKVYPIEEAADALRHFGEQHARGKIAIVVGAES